MAENNGRPPPSATEPRDLIGLTDEDGTATPIPDRWSLIRDLLVFQGKLFADGVRDLLLSPISIIAGMYALLSGGERPGRQFYDLLHMGRRTEKWINLFGAADRLTERDDAPHSDASVDQMVDQLEEMILTQYEKGGLTASAKTAIDRAIDAIQRRKP